jgi:PKD repeat protein
LHYLLFNRGSVGANCGVADLPSDTSATDYTTDDDPGLLLAALTNMTSTGSTITDASAGTLALYATDDTTAFSYGITTEDGAGTINCATEASAELRLLEDDQTVLADGATALGTAKFTITQTTAGGGKFAYLALEDASGTAGTTANFDWSWPAQSYRDNPVAGETITFNDLSDAGGAASLNGWTWEWDDGTANGTTQAVTHSFSDEGVYNVKLSVTDDAAGSDDITIAVTVDPAEPVWDYSLDVTSGVVDLDVTVTWVGTTISGQTIDTTESYATIWREIIQTLPRVYRYYKGFGTSPTITIPEAGTWAVGLYIKTTIGNEYYIAIPEGTTYENVPALHKDVIRTYEDKKITLRASPSASIPHTGPLSIAFTAEVYPYEQAEWDWDFGDGNTAANAGPSTSNTFSAVSSTTVYTVEAEATFDSGLVQTKTLTVKMVPARTQPRVEADILALMTLVKQVSGCIETTDWAVHGSYPNTYVATLDRPWAASTARVTEDGDLLTAQASVALVDANAGSYYVTMAGDNITINVHPTGSDNPATNGSRYRFIRPA